MNAEVTIHNLESTMNFSLNLKKEILLFIGNSMNVHLVRNAANWEKNTRTYDHEEKLGDRQALKVALLL